MFRPPKRGRSNLLLALIQILGYCCTLAASQSVANYQDQKQDLLQFYQDLSGSDWVWPTTRLDNGSRWDPSVDHCTWYGVVCCPAPGSLINVGGYDLPCELEGTVGGVLLPGHNLVGDIGASGYRALADTLVALDLDVNLITSNTTWLDAFSKLRFLAMRDNGLQGTLDARLPDLQVLRLSGNELQGDITSILRNLDAPLVVDLRRNNIEGSLPSDIPHSLLTLRLDFNNIGGSMAPLGASGSTLSLQTLTYSFNSVTGELPSELPHTLTTFDASHNKLEGPLPQGWLLSPLLRSLVLTDNSLAGTLPSASAGALQVLLLGRNRFSGPLPAEWLRQSLDLRSLDVAGNPALTGPLPDSFSRLTRLTNLEAASTQLQADRLNSRGEWLPEWATHVGAPLGEGLDVLPQHVLCDGVLTIGMPNLSGLILDPLYSRHARCGCEEGYRDPQDLEGGHTPGDPRTQVAMACEAVQAPRSQRAKVWTLGGVAAALAAALLLCTVCCSCWVASRGSYFHGGAAGRRRGPPRRNHRLTLVQTDVEGSTELWEWKDAATMEAMTGHHDRIIRQQLMLCDGYEVTTEGDAFLIAFHDCVDALAFCISTQQQLLEGDWPHELDEHPASKLVFCSTRPSVSDHERDDGTATPMGRSCTQDFDMMSPYLARQPSASSEPSMPLFRGLRVRMGLATGIPEEVTYHRVTTRVEYAGDVLKLVQAVVDTAVGGQIIMDHTTSVYSCDQLEAVRQRVMAVGAQQCRPSFRKSLKQVTSDAPPKPCKVPGIPEAVVAGQRGRVMTFSHGRPAVSETAVGDLEAPLHPRRARGSIDYRRLSMDRSGLSERRSSSVTGRMPAWHSSTLHRNTGGAIGEGTLHLELDPAALDALGSPAPIRRSATFAGLSQRSGAETLNGHKAVDLPGAVRSPSIPQGWAVHATLPPGEVEASSRESLPGSAPTAPAGSRRLTFNEREQLLGGLEPPSPSSGSGAKLVPRNASSPELFRYRCPPEGGPPRYGLAGLPAFAEAAPVPSSQPSAAAAAASDEPREGDRPSAGLAHALEGVLSLLPDPPSTSPTGVFGSELQGDPTSAYDPAHEPVSHGSSSVTAAGVHQDSQSSHVSLMSTRPGALWRSHSRDSPEHHTRQHGMTQSLECCPLDLTGNSLEQPQSNGVQVLSLDVTGPAASPGIADSRSSWSIHNMKRVLRGLTGSWGRQGEGSGDPDPTSRRDSDLAEQPSPGGPFPDMAPICILDMGNYLLNASFKDPFLNPNMLSQVLCPGLEERVLHFPPLGTEAQLSPGYLDAPGALSVPLPRGGVPRNMSAAGMLPVVTAVFCGISGLKELTGYRQYTSTIKQVLRLYNDCVRTCLAAANGYECQEQEGCFMCVFAESGHALQWACMVQEILMEMDWSPQVLALPGMEPQYGPDGMPTFRGPRVQIGLCEGHPTRIMPHTSTGRADYFGPLVNRAARIAFGAAKGGRVVCTRATAERLVEKLSGHELSEDAKASAGTSKHMVLHQLDDAPIPALFDMRGGCCGAQASAHNARRITMAGSISGISSGDADQEADAYMHEFSVLSRIKRSNWTWAESLTINDMGSFRFKGFQADLVCVMTERLVHRAFKPITLNSKVLDWTPPTNEDVLLYKLSFTAHASGPYSSRVSSDRRRSLTFRSARGIQEEMPHGPAGLGGAGGPQWTMPL